MHHADLAAAGGGPVDSFLERFCDLMSRTAGGLSVTLLWDRLLRLPFVHVHDSATGDFFVLETSADDAPFAYAHPTVAASYLPKTSMAEVASRMPAPVEIAA